MVTPAPQPLPVPQAAAVAPPDASDAWADLPDLPDLPQLAAPAQLAASAQLAAPPAERTPAPTTPPMVLLSPTAPTPAPVSPTVSAPAPIAMSNQVTTAPFAAEEAPTPDNDNREPDQFSPDFGSEGVPGPASDQTLADFASSMPTVAGAATPAPEAPGVAFAREVSSEAVTPRATQSTNERTEHPTQRLRAVSDGAADAIPGQLAETPLAAAPVPSAAVRPGEISGNRTGPAQTTASGEFSSTPLSAGGPGGGGSLAAPYATPPRGEATSSRRRALGIGFLLLAAAVVIAGMLYRFFAASEPPAVAVEAIVPAPQTIYRYWDNPGRIELAKSTPLAFDSDGRIAEVVAEGTRFGAGDSLAMLDSGKKFGLDLTRARERLVHYEGMREKMMAAGNRPELRQAELKIVEKKRLIAEAQTSLAKHSLIAAEAGEVAEVLVAAGGQVKAGAPVLRTKGTAFQAIFELPRDDADKARQLGFCRIDLEGKPLECSLAASGGDETHVAIELPNDPAVAAGKTVRLARNRLDAVFSVPTTALVRVGDTDRLYVVGPTKRAELRVVAVADRAATDAIITQGIDVGDRVITAPPPHLRPDTHLIVTDKAP